jgi:hypothetical protein
MPWPAWLHTTEPRSGTCYIRGSDFPAMLTRHNHSGQAWKYKRTWSTYCPNRRVTYKAVDRLEAQSPDDFWQIMEAARHAEINPPTSFADLFLSVYRSPMPRITVRSAFMGFKFGGWNEAFRRGEIRGKVYHYDINSAYRWAASLGLPDMRTAYPTKDFSVPYGIFLVTNVPVGAIPWNRTSRNAVHMVTSEERNALNLPGDVTVIKGWAFCETVRLNGIFEKIDTLFSKPIASRISRAFWGMYNTTMAPEVWSWKHGEKIRHMKNPWYNPIWSAFITSRVKLRINVYRGRAIHCATDSVHILGHEIETGTAPGDWKLVGIYDDMWCRAPNHWGDGPYTLKWSGRGSILARPENRLQS